MKFLRTRGPRSLKTNRAAFTKVYAAAGVILALCIALGVTTYFMVKNGQQAYAARTQLENGIETDLTQVVRAFDEMSAPRANVQGTLLPTMRRHLYSAYAFNTVLTDVFGRSHSVFENQLYRDVEGAIDAMDKLIDQGQTTASAQSELSGYMQQIRSLLSQDFAGNSMI